MNIIKAKIENFRSLKDTTIELENDLSLIIGKNNSGKTSFLELLQKFLDSKSPKFNFNDFSTNTQEILCKIILDNNGISDDKIPFISLRLYIKYDENSNLANISEVMMDLDPDNNIVVLSFECRLRNIPAINNDFITYCDKVDGREKNEDTLAIFLKRKGSRYFETSRRSIFYDVKTKQLKEDEYIDLIKEKISIENIFNLKFIDAKRTVSNKPTDATLSSKAYTIYEKQEHENEEIEEELENVLAKTDSNLDDVYAKIFESIIEDVKNLGGMNVNDTNIKVMSTLQGKSLLENNSSVVYEAENNAFLPESYNGLGYMNLISIIFDIYILINEFYKTQNETPSDVNILFIEEPEAHTHPQMQYIFIKNIKELIAKYANGINLQTIITTHSAHIVSESEFDHIKYFKKENHNIISKNLTELQKQYKKNNEEEHYRFLKKYLTLNRSELFFADKVIFIEGSTERILMPAFIEKFDSENSSNATPLKSQNISIIETGNYSHIFKKFIEFIRIKTLIITDIDTGKKNANNKMEKAPVKDAENTTNASLKAWYPNENFDAIKNKTIEEMIATATNKTQILCVYQTEEENHHARSFEEAFCHINKNFPNKDDSDNAYDIAEKIPKKTDFAIDILLKSKDDFSNWNTPKYIQKGLEWLKTD